MNVGSASGAPISCLRVAQCTGTHMQGFKCIADEMKVILISHLDECKRLDELLIQRIADSVDALIHNDLCAVVVALDVHQLACGWLDNS